MSVEFGPHKQPVSISVDNPDFKKPETMIEEIIATLTRSGSIAIDKQYAIEEALEKCEGIPNLEERSRVLFDTILSRQRKTNTAVTSHLFKMMNVSLTPEMVWRSIFTFAITIASRCREIWTDFIKELENEKFKRIRAVASYCHEIAFMLKYERSDVQLTSEEVYHHRIQKEIDELPRIYKY